MNRHQHINQIQPIPLWLWWSSIIHTTSIAMVVAGVHEEKNEINARVGYFKLGINLKTEKPSALQLRKSVEENIG